MTSEARHYWVGHPPGGRYPPERIGDLGSAWIDSQVDEWMDAHDIAGPVQPVNCDHLTYRSWNALFCQFLQKVKQHTSDKRVLTDFIAPRCAN